MDCYMFRLHTNHYSTQKQHLKHVTHWNVKKIVNNYSVTNITYEFSDEDCLRIETCIPAMWHLLRWIVFDRSVYIVFFNFAVYCNKAKLEKALYGNVSYRSSEYGFETSGLIQQETCKVLHRILYYVHASLRSKLQQDNRKHKDISSTQ
jgi:hypothetical protein